MMTYEERERIRARASGRLARWLGITWASDTRRLLDEMDNAESAGRLTLSVLAELQSAQWDKRAGEAERAIRDDGDALHRGLVTAARAHADAENLSAYWLDGYSEGVEHVLDTLRLRLGIRMVPPGADPLKDDGASTDPATRQAHQPYPGDEKQ